MNQKTNDLRKQVKITSFELDKILKSGGDTFQARKNLKDAQEKLQTAELKQQQLSENEQADVQVALNKKADEMVAEQAAALNAEISERLAIEKPVAILPRSLALNILMASDALRAATDKGKIVNKTVEKLRNRRAQISNKRQELIEKRSIDSTRDDQTDASTLALFDLDIQRLDTLIDEEKNNAAEIDTTSEQKILSNAEMMLYQTVKEEKVRCLNELTRHLENALVAAANEMVSMGVPAGHRYKPNSVLRSASQSGVI